jgi:hypothetical protein
VSFAAITVCVASQQVFIVFISLRLSPETFGYTIVKPFPLITVSAQMIAFRSLRLCEFESQSHG